MKDYIVILIMLSSFIPIQSQSIKIIGKVIDSSGIALDHASVILLDQSDSSIINFTMSDRLGVFSIENISVGKYLLQINYTGYHSYWKKLDLIKTATPLNLETIALQSQNYILPIMEIKAEHSPIKFGKDTIEYNAVAFKVHSGDVVEDLLKKLPGIDVEGDGSVKAYGEKVQNVLVDGKEFFGKDTRVATKNLEADAIEKVQVFDKKSDQAAFTGVDDGRQEKTINLQLKENKKQGYFGNANAAAGTNERYAAKANVNRFSSRSRFSFVGTANNINEQGFSIQEYIDFMGGIGAFMSGGGGRVKIELNDNSGIPLMGSGQISGIQNSTASGINYSNDLCDKTEMTGSIFYSKFSNILSDHFFRQNIGDNFYYNTTEDKEQNSKSNSQSVNLYVKHKLDSTQNLTFRLTGGRSDSKLESNSISKTFQTTSQLLNESQSDYHINGMNYQFKSSLAWMKKLRKPGRSVVGKLSSNLQNYQRAGNLSSVNNFYTITNISDSIHQRQDLQDKAFNYEGSLSYTEPLGRKKYLELNASHSNYQNLTHNDFFDIIENKQEQINELLTKAYISNYNLNSGGLNFIINRNKYHLTAGFKMQNSTLSGKLSTQTDTNISKNFTKILPAVFGDYQIGPANHFNLGYQTNLQEPSIEQLQPSVNNSDPLNIYIGNPHLNPEYSHELNASYFYYNQFNFTSLFANLNGAYTQDKITNIVHIDSAYRRVIQPVNVPFDKSIRAGIDFNTPIRPLKINTRIRLSSGISNGILFVNVEKNQITKLKNGLNISIENRNKDLLEAQVGWRIIANKTKYSLSNINNQNYSETGLYADVNLLPLKNFTLKSNFELRTYNSSLFKEKITIPLWELSFSYLLLKDNKLKLQIKFFDLLNENKGIRRTSQLNYVEEERSNVLGRYAMLQVGYAIRGFSSGKKNGIEIKLEQ